MNKTKSGGGMRGKSGSETAGGGGSRIPVPSVYYTPTPTRKHRPTTINKHSSLQSLNCIGGGLSVSRYANHEDDDTDSVRSFASGYSACSSASVQCAGHAPFGKNGTTYSGRNRKYVVHCSSNHGSPEQYLTPTQRANSTIRHLKGLLTESRVELDEKEKEIARLTKEIVELRLVKVEEDTEESEREPEERREGDGGADVGDGAGAAAGGGSNNPQSPVSIHDTCYPHNTPTCIVTRGGGSPLAVSTSLSDSGHFEELSPHPSPRVVNSALERELDKLKHQHMEEVKALKDSSNAQVDTLVLRLAEANDRYFDISSQLETVQAKLDELEREKEEMLARCRESEEKHKHTYLQMFNKGQQAAIFQQVGEDNREGEPILTLPELMKQLEVTKQELESVKTMYRKLLENRKSKSEQDAEVTLQFLKSAVYYFLTDRENVAGHLAAIQSILGFSSDERQAIEKSNYAWK